MKNQMELRFPAAAQNEAFARMVISAFLVRFNPTMSLTAEIRTAVSEAVTNAVVHAYKDSGEGEIVLRAALEDEKLLIEVEDFGCGIENIEQAMQPFFTSQPDKERTGMGFSLMQSFMDDVRVQSRPGNGTTVKMAKRLCAEDSDVL